MPARALRLIALKAFRDNYIWTLTDGAHACVVDPGEARPVLDFLQANAIRLCAILNTHHHYDHVNGNTELLEHFAVPVYGPRSEDIASVSIPVGEDDRVEIAALGLRFKVLDIPGHTAGHVAYYDAMYLFCGDTLFACGCGRLFEGTAQQMSVSLAKLAALPAATSICCGHEYTLANIAFARAVEPGNQALAARAERERAKIEVGLPTLPALLADEHQTNPFLRCDQPAVVAAAERYVGHRLNDAVAVFAALREWKNNFTP
mgnify:CR=1 FL=1